jgi:hypothetical protein
MSANFVLVLRQSESDEGVFKRVGSIGGESDGTRIEKSRFFEGVKMEKFLSCRVQALAGRVADPHWPHLVTTAF